MRNPDAAYFFALCGACVLVGLMIFGLALACADEDKSPAADPGWVPVSPPRLGLRCWRAGHLSYCEPDPTATHGASP
jgi:hypothetical protein